MAANTIRKIDAPRGYAWQFPEGLRRRVELTREALGPVPFPGVKFCRVRVISEEDYRYLRRCERYVRWAKVSL